MSLPGFCFRELNDKEMADFQRWARENYEIGAEISELWHPAVRDECERMNARQSVRVWDEEENDATEPSGDRSDENQTDESKVRWDLPGAQESDRRRG